MNFTFLSWIECFEILTAQSIDHYVSSWTTDISNFFNDFENLRKKERFRDKYIYIYIEREREKERLRSDSKKRKRKTKEMYQIIFINYHHFPKFHLLNSHKYSNSLSTHSLTHIHTILSPTHLNQKFTKVVLFLILLHPHHNINKSAIIRDLNEIFPTFINSLHSTSPQNRISTNHITHPHLQSRHKSRRKHLGC